MSVESNRVTIIRNGQHTFVRPPVAELLPTLQTTTHVAVDDARYGVRIVREPSLLAWTADFYGDEVTVAYAGLENRIKAILEAASYDVRLMVHGHAPCLGLETQSLVVVTRTMPS